MLYACICIIVGIQVSWKVCRMALSAIFTWADMWFAMLWFVELWFARYKSHKCNMTSLHLRMWEARSRRSIHTDSHLDRHSFDSFAATAGLVFIQHTCNVRDGPDSWRTQLSVAMLNAMMHGRMFVQLLDAFGCFLHWTRRSPGNLLSGLLVAKTNVSPLESEEIVKAIRSGAVRKQIPECMGLGRG